MSQETMREIKSLESMKSFAEDMAKLAGARLLVLLDGPMGAGKTQFTRFFLSALGSNETVSPSFAIHNSYLTSQGPVEHFDLFRLESEDDLESTGFWDFFRHHQSIVLIEWASRLTEMNLDHALPRAWPKLRIRIERVNGENETRRVFVSWDR